MNQQSYDPMSSNIRVQDIPSPAPAPAKPAAPPRSREAEASALGFWAAVIGILFGLPVWFFGAVYTMEGLLLGINTGLAWATIPYALALPVGYWILLAIPVGVIFSRIEFWQAPVHKINNKWISRPAPAWIVWGSLILIDVASTYAGYQAEEHTWPIAQAIASGDLWTLIWSLVLTFCPEWLIIRCWRRIVYGS